MDLARAPGREMRPFHAPKLGLGGFFGVGGGGGVGLLLVGQAAQIATC